MLWAAAETAHLPLSEYSVAQLRTKAAELRGLARIATTLADIDALNSLGSRFEALAAPPDAVPASGIVPTRPNSVASPCSRRRSIIPRSGPERVSLACQLMAYNLVAAKT
jgi:hypothetical protein